MHRFIERIIYICIKWRCTSRTSLLLILAWTISGVSSMLVNFRALTSCLYFFWNIHKDLYQLSVLGDVECVLNLLNCLFSVRPPRSIISRTMWFNHFIIPLNRCVIEMLTTGMCFSILAEFNIYTQSEVHLIIIMASILKAALDVIQCLCFNFFFYLFKTFCSSPSLHLYKKLFSKLIHILNNKTCAYILLARNVRLTLKWLLVENFIF